MVSVEQVREWVQHRIDYWEEVCEKHQDEIPRNNEDAYKSGFEEGEDRGMLAAYYMVIEYINGQRR